MPLVIDSETSGLDLRHSSRPFLFTLYDDPESIFFEWDVCPFTRRVLFLPEDLDEIEERIEEADKVLGRNLKFDITAWVSTGRKWHKHWWPKILDTIFSAHLVNSSQPTNLTHQALLYLGIDIQPYEDRLESAVKECRRLVSKKVFIKEHGQFAIAKEGMAGLPSAKGKNIWRNDYWLPRAYAKFMQLPPTHKYWTVLSDYASIDSVVTYKLHEVHQKIIKDRDLEKMYHERLKLIRVLYLMEERGITYSQTRMQKMMAKFEKESEELGQECFKASGGLIDTIPKTGTSNAMRNLLFKRWKLPVVERSEDTGEPSFDKHAIDFYLNTLDPKGPQYKFVKALKSKRGREKAISDVNTYDRFSTPYGKSKEYRLIHGNINPTGTKTLRFSHTAPNESNISNKDDANLREGFGPAEGREWWSLDYQNLELRLPAYRSGEEAMIQLFEKPNDPPYFGSYHLLNASVVYEDEFNECLRENPNEPTFNTKYKPTLYTWTKQFGFAIQYGAQEEKADKHAKRPGSYKKLNSKLFKVAGLRQELLEFANKHGYIETMRDKEVGVYPIAQVRRDGRIKPTQPFSHYIQSTGMWVMERGMVRVQEYLDTLPSHFMIIQIHDEIVLDFPKSKVPFGNLYKILHIKRLMEMSGDDIGIPMLCEYKMHDAQWNKSAKIPDDVVQLHQQLMIQKYGE